MKCMLDGARVTTDATRQATARTSPDEYYYIQARVGLDF